MSIRDDVEKGYEENKTLVYRGIPCISPAQESPIGEFPSLLDKKQGVKGPIRPGHSPQKQEPGCTQE